MVKNEQTKDWKNIAEGAESKENQTPSEPIGDSVNNPEDRTEDTVDQNEGEAIDAETLETGEMAQVLKEAQAKAEKHYNSLLRTQAELQNIQKRTEQEKQNIRKFAVEGFTKELLAIADSLEQALAIDHEDDARVKNLHDGVELTLKMLLGLFEKHGVKQIDPLGEAYNPAYHEAMTIQPSSDHEPNHVITVIQKGYVLHERVIRPARVIVSGPAAR